MQDMNHCLFNGVVISEPKMVTLPSGALKTEFALIFKEARWNSETRADEVVTTVLGFEAWFEVASVCSELRKGDRVQVTAQATRRQIEDKATGKKQEKVRFTVSTVDVVRLGKGGTAPRPEATTEPPPF